MAHQHDYPEATPDLIEQALSHISPDCGHNERARLAMAIYSELGERGKDIWMDWAGARSKPDPLEDRSTWRSARAVTRVRIGTLFGVAKDNGFRFPEAGERAEPPDPAKLAAERARKEAERLRAEAEYRERADRAARDARDLWGDAQPATLDGAPYLARKGLAHAHGARMLRDGTLLVPMLSVADGQLLNVQRIGAEKRFLPGGRKSELAFLIGLESLDQLTHASVVLLAEGFATAASVHEATGLPVLVCFDAGNLAKVAAAVRQRWPALPIVVCADDDRETAERSGKNPGREGAMAAVRAASTATGLAVMVLPTDLPDTGTDFNDLHQARGLDPVEALIMPVVTDLLAEAVEIAAHPAPAPAIEGGEVPPAAPAEPESPPSSASGEGEKKPAAKKRKTPAKPARREREGDEWEDQLITRKGELVDCRENIYLILTNHPAFRGRIAFDEFAYRLVKLEPMPWGDALGEWSQSDDFSLGLWLAQTFGLIIKGEGTLAAGVAMTGMANKRHPVRDWLQSLQWDGTDRLGHWLHECLSTRDDTYHTMVGSWFLMGMVNRVLVPGCQMDNMIILEGKQGRRKSSALRVLAGDSFADTPLKIGDKDAVLNLAGVWLYEVAELDSFNKAEVTAVKQYVTSRVDRVREPYARRAVDRPRSCVLAGTTNQDEYFKDPTGARRFWPIRIRRDIDLDKLAEWREQLFAEAMHRLAAGERYYPTREEAEQYIEPEQRAREIEDPWMTRVAFWVDDEGETGGYYHPNSRQVQHAYTSLELLTKALNVQIDKIDSGRQMASRIGVIMNRLGWAKRRDASGKRDWRYIRPGYTPSGTPIAPRSRESVQASNPGGPEVGRV